MAKTAKQPHPSKIEFTDELIARICTIISTSKYGLHRIVKAYPDLPSVSTIIKELAINANFSAQYAHAREAQAEFILDEAYDILDDNSGDNIETENGAIPNNEWISRSKARADFRKWMASRLAPKKYGDKIQTEHSGEIKTVAPPTFIIKVDE